MQVTPYGENGRPSRAAIIDNASQPRR